MYQIAFAGFRHGHISALFNQVKACDRVALFGCWEDNAEARAAAEQNYGAVFTHENYEDLLNAPEVDIIAIGDYFGRRGELAIRALKAGKHVIVDKPICTSLAELDEIERLSKEKNLKVGCMLSLRYSHYTAVAKELIASGELGEIHAISFNGQHPLNYGSRPMWYFEPGKHGGVINDLGIHGIDLVEYLTGMQVKNVTAARAWNAFATEQPDFQDCTQFMIELDNGCGVMGDVSYSTPDKLGFSSPYYWQFLIWGSKGLLRFAEDGKPLEAYLDYGKTVKQIMGDPCTNNHITDFLDEIEGKENILVTTEEVIRSQRDTLRIQAAVR